LFVRAILLTFLPSEFNVGKDRKWRKTKVIEKKREKGKKDKSLSLSR
jgi:hypothetical protein